MTAVVIVDTGPIVASLNRADRFHGWTLRQLQEIELPLVSCEAVMSETAYLLRRAGQPATLLMEWVLRTRMFVPAVVSEHQDRLQSLLESYRDTPMSFADACLVALSEVFTPSHVLTLDSDFVVYRRHRDQQISVIMPE